MKLFYSPNSPFVRKVMATAIAAGVDAQITKVTTNPWDSTPELLAQNPLSKIPCLITEDGLALFDSPVICDYLDHIGDSDLFPPPGKARWRALKQQATADGLMDAAILRRNEQNRTDEPDRAAVIARQKGIMTRALDLLEQEKPAEHLDIGTLTIACALGYLDLRFADDAWRTGRPHLAQWYETFKQRPEIAQTAHPTP